jgi:hypothetical protein
MNEPGRKLMDVFERVTDAVERETGNAQTPWIDSSFRGDFYFFGPTTVNITPEPAATVSPEIVFWQSIAGSNHPADFEAYLRQFPNGIFAGLARVRLASLASPPSAVAPPTAALTPPKVKKNPPPVAKQEPVPQQVPLPAASMSAEEPTSKGDEAVKRKDYTEAMRRYRKAADQGNVYAQTSIGVLYEKGSGVTQDYAEAMRWYRKAADQGYAQALTNIGTLYRQGSGVTQDYAEAMRWYRKGADRGNSSSLLNIGFLYEKGWGVTQDHVEAMRWYMKASDLGNAQAQYNIGQHYYNGSGVAKNYAEAMRWFRQAADRGRADAQNILSSGCSCFSSCFFTRSSACE